MTDKPKEDKIELEGWHYFPPLPPRPFRFNKHDVSLVPHLKPATKEELRKAFDENDGSIK